MIYFKRLLLVVALFSQVAFAHGDSEGKVSAEKPNVLMILVDDLNDYQGVFGGHPQAKTPNIDRLAKSGIRFTNMQTNIPVCQPSRNSLFTGVYPHDSKDFGWIPQHKQKMLKNNKTIMELFNENGYYTLGTGKLMHGGLTKNWQDWGMPHKHDYGPMYFDGEKSIASPNVPEPFRSIGAIDGAYGRLSSGGISTGEKGKKGWVYGWDKKPMRYINENDRDLMPDELHAQWAVKAINKLAKGQQDKPFFMGVGFMRPHTPLYAPDRFFDMFPIDELELAPWMKNDNKDTYYKDNFPSDIKGLRYYETLLASYNNDHELAMKHFLQAYLACITFMDEQVGKVLAALESHPELNNNTMVLFTADHGWQMGEKGYVFKNSPWEESTRIPLIVRPVTNKAGIKEISQPVSLIDLYPTLVDYASLKGSNKKNRQGGDLGGFSLRSLIENTGQWQGPNGALSVIGNYASIAKGVTQQNYSYRTKNWRYIRYSDGQEELYNHKNDPYEWHNVAANIENRKVKAKLLSEVNEIVGQAIDK
ncbi:sulfatase [Thalassotalea sp. PLHSN55]|uniref:sulfatase n=1 Tax=Thalassotalea sp. PLHSN55 TaxID=3435888 RepID=UPI003F84DF2E